MRRVVVTGAAGFVGRRLIARLAASSWKVRALIHRDPPPAYPGGVEIVRGDVTSAEEMRRAMAGCEAVVHLAGRVHALDEPLSDSEQHRVTFGGTTTVGAAAVAAGLKRFVFLSSLAMYRAADEIQDEDSPLAPLSEYARAKYEAELELLRLHAERKIEVCILRAAAVYGAGCKGNLPRMIAAIRRGWMILPDAPDALRSFVHVENLVDAILLALEHPRAAGRTYIVSDARPYSIAEIADSISQVLGKRPPRRINLRWMRLAARAGDLLGAILRRRLPLDSIALEKLIERVAVSPGRIMTELGYVPRRDLRSAAGELVSEGADAGYPPPAG